MLEIFPPDFVCRVEWRLIELVFRFKLSRLVMERYSKDSRDIGKMKLYCKKYKRNSDFTKCAAHFLLVATKPRLSPQ